MEATTGLDQISVSVDAPRSRSKFSSDGGNMSGMTALAIKALVVALSFTGLLLRSLTVNSVIARKVLVLNSPKLALNMFNVLIGRRSPTVADISSLTN